MVPASGVGSNPCPPRPIGTLGGQAVLDHPAGRRGRPISSRGQWDLRANPRHPGPRCEPGRGELVDSDTRCSRHSWNCSRSGSTPAGNGPFPGFPMDIPPEAHETAFTRSGHAHQPKGHDAPIRRKRPGTFWWRSGSGRWFRRFSRSGTIGSNSGADFVPFRSGFNQG